MPDSSAQLESDTRLRSHLLVFVVLVSPFYLNDFANILAKDWRLWLAIDYIGLKLFPIVFVFWLIRSKRMRASEFGLTTTSVPSFAFIFLIVTLIGTVIDQNGYRWIENVPGYAPLGGMPAIGNPTWDWIDLTLGLLLVGIVEELVFRGYMHAFLSRFTTRAFLIVVISAAAFGLIHWSLGLHAVLITSLIGAVLMVAFVRTQTVPPLMLAHFAINFIAFAGVIPKSIFSLD